MKNTAALVALALAVAALVAHARPSRACSLAADTAVPFASFPSDGATDVPLNATPFVRGVDPAVGARLEAIALVGPGEEVVPAATATTVVTDLGGPVDLVQLLPQAPLSPRTAYRIVHEGGDIATFTTGDAEDEEAPRLTPSDITSTSPPTDGEESWFGLWSVSSCGSFPGSATLRAHPSEPVIVFATFAEEPSLASDMVASSREDELFVSLREDGAVRVLAVDVAGHLSNVDTVEVDLPEAGGCAQAGDGVVPLGAALALLWALPRRGASARRRANGHTAGA